MFEEGSPQEWLELLKDVDEVWTQNTINGPTDCVATMHAALRGDSLTAFESALEDARVDPDEENDEPIALTVEHIETALESVTNIVFPHHALEIQKL